LLRVEDIEKIVPVQNGKGYEIIFKDGRKIWMTKARTIVALLVLIRYGQGNESDLAKGPNRIPELKRLMAGKYPDGLIKDSYGDANKPFSELWNEEGFIFIGQSAGKRAQRSQDYTLSPADHDKLFLPAAKAHREAPTAKQAGEIQQRLPGRCNLCGAKVIDDKTIPKTSFSRDRLKRRYDHRMPIQHHPEKGSDPANFQILCFYCNKSKWQICHLCNDPVCEKCVLAFPESNTVVYPTKEDISDRIIP